MQIDITPSNISFIALQGGDIHRFLGLLKAVKSPFRRCRIDTCWGLAVFQFSGPEGNSTCAVSIALLEVTSETVINDSGQIVDRYEKVVEELVKRASDKLKLPVGERDLKRRDTLVLSEQSLLTAQ